MITQTFGDTLFTPDSECFKELPSPESLKKHVMISTKPPIVYREAKDANEDSLKISKDSGDEEAWGKEVPSLKSHSQKVNYLLRNFLYLVPRILFYNMMNASITIWTMEMMMRKKMNLMMTLTSQKSLWHQNTRVLLLFMLENPRVV